MLAAMLAILGGAYGGYYYTRSQPPEQNGPASETQDQARRQAEQNAEKQRRDAEAESKRRVALDAEAAATNFLGSHNGRARTEKDVEHHIALHRAIAHRICDKSDRLDRRVHRQLVIATGTEVI